VIINPKIAIKEEWIRFPSEPMMESQLQPNGIDIRIREAHLLSGDVIPFQLYHNATIHVNRRQLELEGGNSYFTFEKGNSYNIECFEMAHIPKNVVALIYGRSSLNRNGLLARASLYDSGYNNYVGFTLYAFNRGHIEYASRVAQIVFMEAGSSSLYNGQYNSDDFTR